MMDARASQLLDEDEFNENSFSKSGPNSAFLSGHSSNMSSVRTHLDGRHKNDLRRLEKDKKEQAEVDIYKIYLK